MDTASTVLDRLQLPEDYRTSRERMFPTAPALSWFIRQNRPRLVDAGALVVHAGRNMVDAVAFDAAVLDLAREKARSQSAAEALSAGVA
jgi:hypothetical protein